MATEVILPKVDMDMATGRISAWHVEAGQKVTKGDVLFEIETDKAAMEIDAPGTGRIGDITGKPGEDIAVGTVVAWIYGEGEEAPQISAPAAEMSAQQTDGIAAEPPSQQDDIANRDGDHSTLPPSGLPAISPTRGESTPAALPTGSGEGGVRASPLARRLAKEAGLDLAAISGSGPHGRVVKADVEKAKAEGGASAPAEPGKVEPSKKAATAPAPAALSDEAVLKLFAEGSYERVPHDAMRRTIARRLVEAKQTVPHFYLTLDCDIDALLKLRKKLNAAAPERDGEPAYKLSVNDLVIKAYAAALKAVPDANVSWTEGAMLKHAHADVGVAVSIPGGLITPIVRRADEKTLSAISNEMKDLAARARERKLKPEEYQGGTGAVSNLGMFGIKDFAAVINPPHATILAVGAGEQRAVVKDGEVTVATMMSVTLSTDHRAVDGALGAELLAAFKRLVENPMAMLV